MRNTQQKRWNLPNLLSAYRILMFPVIAAIVFLNYKSAFAILLCINLFTDILDGFIARRFKLQTAFGARLDSWADVGTYLLAFGGLLRFEMGFVQTHVTGLLLFTTLYVLSFAVTFAKFGGICGLHLYSFKLTGYLQGLFFALLFTYGNIEWFYYLMITAGCLANIEEIVIFTLLRRPQSNVKGLYWVLKNTRHDR